MTAAEPLTFLDPETTEQLRPPCDFHRRGIACMDPATHAVHRVTCPGCGKSWRVLLACEADTERLRAGAAAKCGGHAAVLGFDRIEPLQ